MYEQFYQIDGSHPWRDVSPEGYVDYPVFYRQNGRVIYFNFSLARELGLIPANHPDRMHPDLEKAILQNFSLQILNEHDWINRPRLPQNKWLKDRLYMATRYLQLQHKSRQGATSGDGRSIWNGTIVSKGRCYDLSSCGTGSTILSPGAQEADHPIPTGSNEYGYASGLADLDELLAGAIMSEIFYREGLPTERALTVIEYEDKSAVGVRCAPNLLRPAHMFRYLKMGLWKELKASFDYFLDRQQANGFWTLPKSGPARYQKGLDYLARQYARLAALMEEEYIFNWLAWDGDNLLAHGAMLDYGSIRQFAAKHNKYRYEDVDRFSTCLSEQRIETRRLIQTFVQAVDFIVTKERRPWDGFADSPYLTLFDDVYSRERQTSMLRRMGYTAEQGQVLIEKHNDRVQAMQKVLNYFEDIKTVRGEDRVPDGVDHPPVFLIRNILCELPVFFVRHYEKDGYALMPAEEFCTIMAGSYVDQKDLLITEARERRAIAFQQYYRDLVAALAGELDKSERDILKEILKRSCVINYPYRRTGDGLTWIVQEAIKARTQMTRQRLMDCIERFIQSQVLVPGKWKPIEPHELAGNSKKAQLLRKMQKNLELYKELI